jgi:3-hydroxyisobutyrate dehydrogenase
MGAGMARNVLRAGLELRVWNRTRAKVAPLGGDGAVVAESPAEAVTGADVIITMLRDSSSVAEVITEAAPGLRAGQVWAQTTTVGVAGAADLAALATKYGLTIVDAPVLGTKAPAEQGQLLIFASGDRAAEETLRPVFDAVGRKTVWLGDSADDAASGAASRLKLVANSWVLAVTAATGEALGLAKALDVDASDFLEAVAGGPLDLPYLRLKAKAILEDDYDASFTVNNAAKDADLIVEAGRAKKAHMDVASAVAARMHRADARGHGDKDMAANYFASFDD